MSWLKILVLPSNLIVVLIALGLLLLFLRRWRHIARLAFILAATFYILFSSGPVAALLLTHLEYRYPALQDDDELDPAVRTIVLLAAYTADDPLMPLSGKFNSHAMFRIVEANNIYKRCHECRILISGKADAALMRQQLTLLGVSEVAIEIDDVSEHTVNSAINLRDRLKGEQFYLVTSAGHMPRSMGVFLKQGLRPIPAPTDYLMPKDIFDASLGLSSSHLNYSDLAINEYAGILWYKLSGKF